MQRSLWIAKGIRNINWKYKDLESGCLVIVHVEYYKNDKERIKSISAVLSQQRASSRPKQMPRRSQKYI